MKKMGKWAVLLFVAVLIGCSSGGSSSDENPYTPDPQNPIQGTWKVSLDPQNESIDIQPVSLGVTGNPVKKVLNESHALPGTTAVNLGFGQLVKKSEVVCSSSMANCVCGGTKYVADTDYTIVLGNLTTVGTIARTGTSAIADNGTVYMCYQYYTGDNTLAFEVTDGTVTYTSGTLTTAAPITIQNTTYNTIEEIRSYTGGIAGPGAANNPTLSNSDYPLATGDTPTTSPTTQQVAGWNSGVCYTTHGFWYNTATPRIQGCTADNPRTAPDGGRFNFQWLDPVCGKLTENWTFGASKEQYVFYMQLTGTAYPWSPDPVVAYATHDSRWDMNWFTTYYGQMAYLVPTNPATVGNYCTGATGTTASYFTGWTGKIKPFGTSDRCGTLITNPHLSAGTYFAFNVGFEYSDWIENKSKTFWDAYLLSLAPKAALTPGAPYIYQHGAEFIWDPTILDYFATGSDQSTAAGTYFRGGFTRHFTAAGNNNQTSVAYTLGLSTKGAEGGSGGPAAAGYVNDQHNFNATAGGAFSFFGVVPAPTTTYLYVTQQAGEQCTSGLNNLPRFGGQWGVAHLEPNGALPACKMVTEGVDSDIDYWLGMIVFRVKATTNPGDWSYLRFDQTANNYLKIAWNNRSADNLNASSAFEDRVGGNFCWKTGNATETVNTCPVLATQMNDITLRVMRGDEVGNPNLYPSVRTSHPGWSGSAAAIPAVTWCGKAYCAGGRQMAVGVVCVQ